MKFEKPAKSLDELITLLQERGLIIEDIEKAKHSLTHIGYYRLTGYFKFFQDKDTNIFQSGTMFQQVLDLYIFDRKLRLLTLDAIEKVEVSIKAVMNDYLSQKCGTFWYLDEKVFFLGNETSQKIYTEFKDKVKAIQEKGSSIFIKAYFEKYDEQDIPSWMLFEELTIGEIATVYKILKGEHQRKISENYCVDFIDLGNWMQLLRTVRNICAHHARLWNKEFNIRLKIEDKKLGSFFILEERDGKKEVKIVFYNTVLVIYYLLGVVNKNLGWLEDLESLFREYNGKVPFEKMGFDNKADMFTNIKKIHQSELLLGEYW